MSDLKNVTMTMSVPDGKGGHIETPPFTGEDLKRVTNDIRRDNGKPPMKADPDFDVAATETYRVTAGELRAFVERIERLAAEMKDFADQQKEVFAEAKGRGYDVKILRQIVALRKKDPQQISEEEAVLALYKEALGM